MRFGYPELGYGRKTQQQSYPVMSFRDLSIALHYYKTKKKKEVYVSHAVLGRPACVYIVLFPRGINHRRLH